MAQKTEHPAGLNKWGPRRVSNVLRPDKRVAEPWVGWAQWPRRVLGAVGAVAYFSCGRAPIAGCVFCVVANSCCSGPGPLAWSILRTVGPISGYGRGPSGVACFGYSGWRVFCECPGLLCMCRGLVGHLLWSVWVLLCGRVLCASGPCWVVSVLWMSWRPPLFKRVVGAWCILWLSGGLLLWGVKVGPNGPVACFAYGRGLLCGAYSVSGQALLLGAWPGPLAGCILCTAGYPYCWACYRLRVFLFVIMWIVPPCLILTAFSPFPGASGNLCAETFIFRVQCLCGRADVWGARKVVFGYGAPGKKAPAPWAHCLIPLSPERAETSYLRVQCFMR